ncbi:7TM-DISM domain-containing protein, partial [Pseudomonas aeruginosa]|uniref:7TM-DISM domain-containing protein n=1 Tax=Pseudomonas aeruginosa TaxID=287 RepID=UPI002B416587
QYNDRPIKNRNFIFPLKLKENCHLQFYLKIRNNSDYLYMPIIVKDSKSLVEYESNRYQLLALYTGAFLFAIAFNIIIFISTR